MSNQILSQVQNLSLEEKKELLGLLDELADAKSREKCADNYMACLLYTSPSPRDGLLSRMPSSA